MIQNIALETAVGFVPIAGDIFDAYFKANIRNLEILERHLAQDGVLDALEPNLTAADNYDRSLVG